MFETFMIYLGIELVLIVLIAAVCYFKRKTLAYYFRSRLQHFLRINVVFDKADRAADDCERLYEKLHDLEDNQEGGFNRLLNRSKYDRKVLKKIKTKLKMQVIYGQHRVFD